MPSKSFFLPFLGQNMAVSTLVFTKYVCRLESLGSFLNFPSPGHNPRPIKSSSLGGSQVCIIRLNAPCTRSGTQTSEPHLHFTLRVEKHYFSSFSCISITARAPWNAGFWAPPPRLGWSRRVEISNTFPGDANAAVYTSPFENHCCRALSVCVSGVSERQIHWKFSCGMDSFRKLPWLEIPRRKHIEYIFQDHVNLYFINLLCSDLTESLYEVFINKYFVGGWANCYINNSSVMQLLQFKNFI